MEQLRRVDLSIKINEESTRAVFLNKHFESLGYSAMGGITHGETAVSGNLPDYVVKANGEPVIAVEPKALGSKLGDQAAGRISGPVEHSGSAGGR